MCALGVNQTLGRAPGDFQQAEPEPARGSNKPGVRLCGISTAAADHCLRLSESKKATSATACARAPGQFHLAWSEHEPGFPDFLTCGKTNPEIAGFRPEAQPDFRRISSAAAQCVEESASRILPDFAFAWKAQAGFSKAFAGKCRISEKSRTGVARTNCPVSPRALALREHNLAFLRFCLQWASSSDLGNCERDCGHWALRGAWDCPKTNQTITRFLDCFLEGGPTPNRAPGE